MARGGGSRPYRFDGYWHLNRRVPKEFQGVDKRRTVRVSTGIAIADDPRGVAAAERVREMNLRLELRWADLRAGRDPDAHTHAAKARDTLQELNLEYKAYSDIVGDLPTLVDRLEKLDRAGRAGERSAWDGVLGRVKPSGIRVSQMIDVYREIKATEHLNYSAGQRRKWLIHKQTELARLQKVVGGDPELSDLTASQIEAYRDTFVKRVLAREISADTAKRSIKTVGAMFNAINEAKKLGLPPLFHKLGIKGPTYEPRRPMSVGHIQNVLLKDGALEDLDEEARCILFAIVETGLRPSEVCGLTRQTIRLKDAIPHVRVRADGRALKTAESRRDIPLVGVSLMAFQRFPDGFKTYADRANNFSDVTNRYLRDHHLLEEEDHVVYSLRHTFADRLDRAKVTERVKSEFMGHKYKREKYGQVTLEEMKDILDHIAFKPPSRV